MAEAYANVTIAHKIHSDRRFDLLGELGGWSRREAAMRMVELWSRCTALQTDRPAAEEIRIHLGANGERLLVDAGLGERCDDGSIRVRGGGLSGGDVDRFSWFAPVQTQQREAGARRARMPGARGAGGKFARSSGPATAPAVASETDSAGPAVTSGSPAVASASPASGFRNPDLIPDLTHRARAIPPPVPQQALRPAPATAAPGTYDHTDPRARGRLAEQAYKRMGAARAELAAQLGMPAPLPLPPWGPTCGIGMTDAIARIREEGPAAPAAVEHVIAAVVAQARVSRELEFVGTKAFTAGGWRHAREWIPGAKPRAGPVRSAGRAIEQPMMRVSNLTEEETE